MSGSLPPQGSQDAVPPSNWLPQQGARPGEYADEIAERERERDEAPASGVLPHARHFRGALGAAFVLSILTLATTVFVAYEQRNWSFEWWSTHIFQVFGTFGLWAAIVATQLTWLRNRARWPQWLDYLSALIAMVVVVVIVLLVRGDFDGEMFAMWVALASIPTLLFTLVQHALLRVKPGVAGFLATVWSLGLVMGAVWVGINIGLITPGI